MLIMITVVFTLFTIGTLTLWRYLHQESETKFKRFIILISGLLVNIVMAGSSILMWKGLDL